MTWIYTNGIYIQVPNQIAQGTSGEYFLAACAGAMCCYIWFRLLGLERLWASNLAKQKTQEAEH